jgi:hypothetical protein
MKWSYDIENAAKLSTAKRINQHIKKNNKMLVQQKLEPLHKRNKTETRTFYFSNH